MTDSTGALSQTRLDLIQRLSEAVAVSGDESRIRAIIRAELEGVVDELQTDRMGNLLAIRRSQGPAKMRIMLAAHMDEVGFIVTAAETTGFLRLAPVGGIKADQFVGKKVWVGPGPSLGVVSLQPIHLLDSSQRRARPTFPSLRVDLGASGDQFEALGVQPGAFGTFATRFGHSDGRLRGKALDDRLGVAILIELLRRPVPGVDLLGAFTVQEEIGARGAAVAAYNLAPDAAIVIDCTPARDLPMPDGTLNPDPNTRMGAGPAIYVADGKTVSDPRLVRLAIETAERLGVPSQIRQPGQGGTDASAIQRARGGVPVVSISVPGRHTHSAIGLADAADFTATETLVGGMLASLAGGLPDA